MRVLKKAEPIVLKPGVSGQVVRSSRTDYIEPGWEQTTLSLWLMTDTISGSYI